MSKVKVLKKILGESLRLIEKMEEKEVVRKCKELEEENQIYAIMTDSYSELIKDLKDCNKEVNNRNKNILNDLQSLTTERKSKFFKSKVLTADIEALISKYQDGD